MDAFVKENNGHKKVNIPQLQFPWRAFAQRAHLL